MITSDFSNIRRTWKQDFLASIVVFFVALPLCMGIAIASGAPVGAGLITGIVGGLVAGSLAGCQLQVSGPAAGLTVIVYEIVQRLGLEMLGLAVLLAGGLQLVAGIFRLGQWFRAVSPAVIHGMLAGIGVLIFASQFHVMVDDKPRGSGLENLATIPAAIEKAVGVPRVAELPERNFRTRSLHAMAELHDKQIDLRASVAELIPYHHVLPVAPALRGVVEPQLEELVDEQEQVAAALEQISNDLTEVRRQQPEAVNFEREEVAVAKAMTASRAAAEALAAGGAIAAVEAQEAAVEAIDSAAARLKNHQLAAGLGILTIVIIVVWQKYAPQKLRLMPGPLLAIIVATALAATFALPVFYVNPPDSIADAVKFPNWSTVANAPWIQLLQTALLIAAVASAETLLCATAVDQLQQGKQRTNYDRELASQGVGNMLCGFLGGLPMTGVIVRSSTNVHAGAQTRLSSMLHGLWLLVFVAALGWVLRMIPTSSLAAVLVYTGYKLVNFKHLRSLYRAGWGEAAIYLATLTTIVVEDLLTGVLVGIALAAVKLLYTFSRLVVKVDHDGAENRYTMRLAGAATFVRLPKLAAALEQIPGDAQLHVELDRLRYIDHACLELFTNWANQHEASGGRLVLDWDSLHSTFRQGPESAEAPADDDTWVERREPALTP